MATASDNRGPDVPRDPSFYSPTLHFGERFKDIYDEFNRHLDGEIVNTCITEGTAQRVGPEKVTLRSTIAGVTYRLVVNPSTGDVLSGYPISINTRYAQETGRWSEAQIDDILEFLRNTPESITDR